jgi:regulator of RNase E activity RraB
LYGASADSFEATIHAAMGNFSAYKFDMGKQHEPDWNQYRNVLYPSEESMERIKNTDILKVLEKHGDTLESVRDVHHWIYFKTSNDRGLFIEQVRQLGYKVENESEDLKEEFPYGIQITRHQSVTPAKIDDAVLELFRLAKELDGEYDGWEAQIIATKN